MLTRIFYFRVNLYIGSLNWEEVPDLTNMSENDSEEALGSVVKFRCMVQSVSRRASCVIGNLDS